MRPPSLARPVLLTAALPLAALAGPPVADARQAAAEPAAPGPAPAGRDPASTGNPEASARGAAASGREPTLFARSPTALARRRLAATRRSPDDTVASAFRLAGRDWTAWARGGLALAALYTLDRPVRDAARRLRADAPEDGLLDDAADRAEWFGDWQGSLPWVVGGSLAVGAVTGGADGMEEALAVLAGTAAGSFSNEALNRAVGRGRPAWEEGSLSLDPFRGHASFPSGHTAYVFGAASGIDVVTEGWLPAAASYAVAGLTGLSRVYHDRHWLTDVAAGAALSTVVSRVATRRALEALNANEEADGAPAATGAGAPGGAGSGAASARVPDSPRLELLAGTRALGLTIRF